MIEKLFGNLKRSRKSFMLYSPLNGEIVPLENIADEVFANGILGKGVAVKPSIGKLYAPCAGVVGHIFETNHAINIISDFGCEILIHIGLDTVKLKGKGFDIKVQEGVRINKGDLLCVFNIGIIESAGLDTVTPMVVTNSDAFEKFDARPPGIIKAGDAILKAER